MTSQSQDKLKLDSAYILFTNYKDNLVLGERQKGMRFVLTSLSGCRSYNWERTEDGWEGHWKGLVHGINTVDISRLRKIPYVKLHTVVKLNSTLLSSGKLDSIDKYMMALTAEKQDDPIKWISRVLRTVDEKLEVLALSVYRCGNDRDPQNVIPISSVPGYWQI